MDLHPRWKKFLDEELKKKYMVELREYVAQRRKNAVVIPEPNKVFEAFLKCPYGLLKVVIVGGEPYPDRIHGSGMAFSTPSNERPVALQNIFKEIREEIFPNAGRVNPFESNDLSYWADQGVLLLHSNLTTEEGKPGAHDKKGWEMFVENTLNFLNDYDYKLVFMFWGAKAKQHSGIINRSKHLVLEADHPGSGNYNNSNWFGNNHFIKCNQFISKEYFNLRDTINWGIWNKK